MRDARSEADRIQHDADFHRLVAAASGNETSPPCSPPSEPHDLARAWRGIAEEGAGPRTVAQHQDILDALAAHDPGRAESAALVHVATTEAWFRQALGERRPSATGHPDPAPPKAAVREQGRG
jgi:GntR family transcriptional repressor for pyruvate dehydrogenase complex